MENVNDTYFDGYYKEIWRTIIPDELTVKEIDFILPYFDLRAGSKVLDLMCGYGRHAIALARKNMVVTAVDNLDDYINEIKKVTEEENLKITAIKNDVMQYKIAEEYDLALCMGNSLNFFNANDTVNLLKNIYSHLKTGGHLFISTFSLTEIVVKNFTAKSWSNVGELKLISDSKYLFHPTRIESDSFILSPDGHIENKKAIDYIFSVAEMETMLGNAGFYLKEIYSIPGRKKFTIGDPRAYIVAEKT